MRESSLSTSAQRLVRALIDYTVLALALWIAFALRFDANIPAVWMRRMLLGLPYVILLQYFTLLAMQVPRFSWRYLGLREVIRIGIALGSAATLLIVVRVVSPLLIEDLPAAQYAVLPYGVIAINATLAFLGITGVRTVRRMLAERKNLAGSAVDGRRRRILLVGAGQAGLLVAREIARSPGVEAVGFLDDDRSKRGQVIHGLTVRAATSELARVAAETEADEVLIAVANAGGSFIRRINEASKALDLPVKIIPGIAELVGGRVSLNRIRSVAIEDLLRRESVGLDDEAISSTVRDRVVLITGAGGSIGSELCRQVAKFEPRRVLLVERSENALFEIHSELVRLFPDVEVVPVLLDITNAKGLGTLLADQRPHVVLHAAAHKHVPMLEWNPREAIANNVFGTLTVARAAVDVGVEVFVMVSTDKAVRPSSVMGATKRCAELAVASLANSGSQTRFVTVRFGNVLGSAGSVIPIFRRQIAAGGPVTVTDARMLRYFMTIPEASQLVLQAATMAQGGEIFILDMGEPVLIVELARDLIRLSGLTPDDDIEIEFTGMRPGEKLVEELSTVAELGSTAHPSIMVESMSDPPDTEAVVAGIDRLAATVASGDERQLRAALTQLVPELPG
ncbi:MAG: polysaccharide biosynthesis protein [Deltaproteobacteria bacterium]|nr:polysaccharide biosynthesis protein [Deltaproteobacteria bacterium]